MKRIAVLLLGLAGSLPALAQTSTPAGPGAAGSARPARGPEHNSVDSAAPPAGTTTVTGAQNQSPGVQQMNDAERQKIDREGK